MINDQQLLAKLRNGEKSAVDHWYKKYAPKILAFIQTKIADSKDAEDLTQETFINCLRQLSLFRGQSSLLTWMIAVAKHEVADYYRKAYAKKAIRALPLSELLAERKISDMSESAEKVKQVLAHLPPETVELLFLKYVDAKKVKEIAAKLNKTAKAVESELFRARGEFKRLYVLS